MFVRRTRRAISGWHAVAAATMWEVMGDLSEKEKGSKPKLDPFFILVGPARLELATNGLKVRCSTN